MTKLYRICADVQMHIDYTQTSVTCMFVGAVISYIVSQLTVTKDTLS